MPSYGDGRPSYTYRTTIEYLRRVRLELEFYRTTLDRLARLESRYQKILARKPNDKSVNNQ